ncbi:enkurin-like [Planoprotostelium fungivorum]|uniref:Enkurin-like n=1 Tax=Planoprotostelium fungivorum TaxID=1890364 RepID=A0A2P6NWL5_9EUKA|nr:enkurin-like [Planoprotostelium fungivorum]
MSGESIYDLIKDSPPPVIKKEYKPKRIEDSPGTKKKLSATLGPAKVPLRDPSNFLKKKEKTAPLEATSKRPDRDETKKQAVPKVDEKPVMGIVTQKNFVKTNRVDAATTTPKKTASAEFDYTKKPDFGKPPKYLEKVKETLKQEEQNKKDAEEREKQAGKPRMRAITAEEREEMLSGLRANYERVQGVYRQMPVALNTLAQRQRKEEYEQQLDLLENDIQLLSSNKELLIKLD